MFKNAYSAFKEKDFKENNYIKNLFAMSVECLFDVTQKDLLLLGLNFLYTRFHNLFDNGNIELKNISIKMKKRIKLIAEEKFAVQELKNFVKDCELG